MRYRVLHHNGIVYDCVATIDQKTYDWFKDDIRTDANQHVKSLVVGDYTTYQQVLSVYKQL